MTFCRIGRQSVRVQALLGEQFAHVPAIKNPEQVTLLEEEKITAYYGGGTLYAEPGRGDPLL
jgi:photosynthetic reaction center H subunit